MLAREPLCGVKDFALSKKRNGSILIIDEFAKIHSNVEVVHDVSKGFRVYLSYLFPAFFNCAFFSTVRLAGGYDGDGTNFATLQITFWNRNAVNCFDFLKRSVFGTERYFCIISC